MIKITKVFICDLCLTDFYEQVVYEQPVLSLYGVAPVRYNFQGRAFGEKHLCYKCFDSIQAAAHDYIEFVKETRYDNCSPQWSDSSQDNDNRGGARTGG